MTSDPYPAVSRWCGIDELPDVPAPTPYGSAGWMRAWSTVTTDPVQAMRCLQVISCGQVTGAAFYLTDGSPAWRAHEAAAGVEPVWSRPVVYGPSPYATYGGWGASRASVIREIARRGLEWARACRADAFVVPGLRSFQVQRWEASFSGGTAVLTSSSHEAPVRGSAGAFQHSIPRASARGEFGRQERRGDEHLILDARHGEAMVRLLPDFTVLAARTAQRYVPGLYGEDLFAAVAGLPGAVLLAARLRSTGELAGGFLCFLHGRTLFEWAAGTDYDAESHVYGWLHAKAVRFAAEHGAIMVDAGRGNSAYKAARGFTVVPLWAQCYLSCRDSALTAALEEMSTRMEAASPVLVTA